jgi:lipid A 3-O-deacylase
MIGRIGRFSRALLLCVVAMAAALPAAVGADLATAIEPDIRPQSITSPSFISEVRLGVFAHDPDSPEGSTADLNAEILFARPVAVADPFWNLFVPRPHIGTSLNTAGKTSFAYAGLTWTVDVWRGLFVEASFGGAVNNGATGQFVPDDRNALGCNASFRESGSLGYRLTESWSMMATIEHYSNAGLCDQNRGVTNIGVRLGYRF